MEFKGYSPFPSIAWENVDSNNSWYITSLVRVKFKFEKIDNSSLWKIVYHNEQEDLFSEDIYYESEEEISSVEFESDYVSFKKEVDLVINANARNPKPSYLEEFISSVNILNEKDEVLKKSTLKIKGKSFITKSSFGFSTSKIEKENKVALRYENSYGGKVLIKDENDEDVFLAFDENNPLGCGIKHKKDTRSSFKSPQISFYDNKEYSYPAGFGFMSRSFKQRLWKAGTYDKEWLDNIHPLSPKDFSYEYNQASNPSLRIKDYLKADYKITLENLMNSDFLLNSDGQNIQSIKIPDLNFITRIRTKLGDIHKKMNLDTFIININEDDISKCCIYASYRIRIKTPKELLKVETMLEEVNNG